MDGIKTFKKQVGVYTFDRFLGKGQFGEVWEAHKTAEPWLKYAVKTVKISDLNKSPKMLELFDTEVSVMAKLFHPNLLHCHDFLETSSNYYLILDLCEGGDLEAKIDQCKSLSEPEAVYFMKQIANGFRELHKWKIMHRDVKPANLFFKGDTVKIGDFGFAKWGDEYTRTRLGTPMTMAPELQDASTIYYSDKVDLWSIGVVFYMMLFGNKGPWDFHTAHDLKTKINTESGNKLKFGKNPISNAAKDLLMRLIEPNPKRRITWDEFFNHKLFVDHSADAGLIDPGRSVFLHEKSAVVEDMWNKNREQKHEEGQMREPEEIPIKKIELHYGKQTNQDDSDGELKFNLELLKKRFSHEKEKTISMCKGSVYCRDASKLTKSEVGIKLVLASLGMAQLTILITEKMISNIENKTNEWHMKNWAEWIKGASPKILVSYLKADLTHYKLLA